LLRHSTWVILDRMSSSTVAALVLGAMGLTLGCATTAAPAANPGGPPPEDAAAYYPFAAGWKWAYNVEREGDTLLATYAVLERTGDTAIVQAGDQRLSYALGTDGIARREGLRTTDYVLRTPIREGASWPIEGGAAKVASVGKTVTVPGGTFPQCATIEERRTNPERITRTTYCAGVGPVMIEVQVHDPLSGNFKTEMRALLMGVTRPGEDPLGPGAATR
jgi:hypothetical protein